MQAIDVVKAGALIKHIGDAIEKEAEKQGCSVVYQFVAHGIGMDFHEAPQISHCYNRSKIALVPGMTFTIEPMINLGQPDAVIDDDDCWTATTIDGKSSAQWEHTLLVTDKGYELLTNWTR